MTLVGCRDLALSNHLRLLPSIVKLRPVLNQINELRNIFGEGERLLQETDVKKIDVIKVNLEKTLSEIKLNDIEKNLLKTNLVELRQKKVETAENMVVLFKNKMVFQKLESKLNTIEEVENLIFKQTGVKLTPRFTKEFNDKINRNILQAKKLIEGTEDEKEKNSLKEQIELMLQFIKPEKE